MYSLELLWPIYNDDNESAVIVESDNLDNLMVIANDADFRTWARLNGAAFTEIWDSRDNLHHFRGCSVSDRGVRQ